MKMKEAKTGDAMLKLTMLKFSGRINNVTKATWSRDHVQVCAF